MPASFDSGTRPINSHYRYESASAHDHEFNTRFDDGQAYTPASPQKSYGRSRWIKFGIPIIAVIIVAAVVGGVLASKNKSNSSTSSTGDSNSTSSGGGGSGGGKGTGNENIGVFFTATDAYGLPVYPTTVRPSMLSAPVRALLC